LAIDKDLKLFSILSNKKTAAGSASLEIVMMQFLCSIISLRFFSNALVRNLQIFDHFFTHLLQIVVFEALVEILAVQDHGDVPLTVDIRDLIAAQDN
jgi:hypothetical protein